MSAGNFVFAIQAVRFFDLLVDLGHVGDVPDIRHIHNLRHLVRQLRGNVGFWNIRRDIRHVTLEILGFFVAFSAAAGGQQEHGKHGNTDTRKTPAECSHPDPPLM